MYEMKRSTLQGKCDFSFIYHKVVSSTLHWGPFKYYVSKEVGRWGQKMANFGDLQYYLC